ncbi:putative C-type lectin domain family 4 member K-like [Triplophysa rosa]|uniref:C-type lectin domain family 4 member K-like n=1 Tax=Triplophysa rosa TaxID=992332 RepID=A0A9W8CAA5_TRIRA|nr:putative C-type lectin domain family 4 member K-like [Triplophysa rosa]
MCKDMHHCLGVCDMNIMCFKRPCFVLCYTFSSIFSISLALVFNQIHWLVITSLMTSSLALEVERKLSSVAFFKQQFSKLTEVENAVGNLTASVVLLTSDQQDTNDRLMEMFGNLKADLESRITNLTRRKPVLSCKAGWQLYLSSCYLFSSTALDWQKSRAFCGAHEALLLILGQDASEWNFIVNRVSKLQSHWIGLTDHTTGQWRWIDGSPYIMDRSQWEPGEPNNLAGEDCAELTKSGKLNDGMCSQSFRFICKAPANEN